MSFYPSQCPMAPVAPASPVPSYQSSSQSGTTSPGGRSATSDTLGDYSVTSITTPTSPVWVSPDSPFSYDANFPSTPQSTRLASPITTPIAPLGAACTSDGEVPISVKAFKSTAQSTRERSASMRALALLESTVGQDVVAVAKVIPDEEAETVDTCKSDLHVARERGAGKRALALLEATAATSPSRIAEETIKDYKSELQTVRERGSNLRALALLDSTVGKEISDVAKATSVSKPSPSLTTRQAAQKRYEDRQRQKIEMKTRAAVAILQPQSLTTLLPKQGKEELAESTRRPRAKTADDVRDPETVAGMKCQVDIEREKIAKKKALQLLSYGCMA
jgi:hypothetical protein